MAKIEGIQHLEGQAAAEKKFPSEGNRIVFHIAVGPGDGDGKTVVEILGTEDLQLLVKENSVEGMAEFAEMLAESIRHAVRSISGIAEA